MSPFRNFRCLTLALAALAFSCGGCGSDERCDSDADCPDGRCRAGVCGPACLGDADCDQGESCRAGACVPECTGDLDCAAHEACVEGACRCASDEACAPTELCTDARCVARTACATDPDCPVGQTCDEVEASCRRACAQDADCGEGRVCRSGACRSSCASDDTCGAGRICEDGACEPTECATFADCPAGSLCDDAPRGRCVPYDACATSPECAANHECRSFTQSECPPGFPCATQAVCLEMPRCLVDEDCASAPGPRYCGDAHCQPTSACVQVSDCASGQECVASLCVPGGCRGHLDCQFPQACVAGACVAAPDPAEIRSLEMLPNVARAAPGDLVEFQVVARAADGSTFPLRNATLEVLDATTGLPSSAATASGGRVTAVSEATVFVRTRLSGSTAPADVSTLHIIARATSGRRVVVSDAVTGLPLHGAVVRGCDGASSSGCASPVDEVTDARGVADFATFQGPLTTFAVLFGQPRSDGFPRYERAAVVDTEATNLLLPLWPNPVQMGSGLDAALDLSLVRSQGPVSIGFTAASWADPSEFDLERLLGERFFTTVPGLQDPEPLPSSVRLAVDDGAGGQTVAKASSWALALPGTRAAIAFGARTSAQVLPGVGEGGFLSSLGGFDFGVAIATPVPLLPRVEDATDADADGVCANAALCPAGTEFLPDYASFADVAVQPAREQTRRTQFIVPDLPAETDTAIVAPVEVLLEVGVLPMGFGLKAAGPVGPGGGRPVGSIVARSGAAADGVEVGVTGWWAIGLGNGHVTGRLVRQGRLPTQIAVGPFLPFASGSTYDPNTRAFSPGQPQWSDAASAGAELARVDIAGTRNRFRVYVPIASSQTSIAVPSLPAAGGPDPAGEEGAKVSVTLFELLGDVRATDALDLGGASLERLPQIVDAWSRWDAP